MSFLDQLYALLNSPAQLASLAVSLIPVVLFAITANNSIKRFKAVGEAYNYDQREELLKVALLSLVPTGLSIVLTIVALIVL
jgi:hypothetical protein